MNMIRKKYVYGFIYIIITNLALLENVTEIYAPL